MQVLAAVVTHALLPALVSAGVECAPSDLPGYPCSDTHVRCLNAISASNLPASSLEPWTLPEPWTHPSSSTAPGTPCIKERQLPAALCGLGGCTMKQTTNPLLLIMQVSNPYALSTKKTSNYCLVQLPSLQCCVDVAIECFETIRILLLLSGDIETNPGPASAEAVLAELKKLSSGQATIISDVQDIKNKLTTTEKTITDLIQRIADLESHYQNLATLKTDVECMQCNTEKATQLVRDLEARFDDAENRSRRCNLIFYGLFDPTPSESFADSEEVIIRHCSDQLDLSLDSKDIERAHRLGRHNTERQRPIIIKFASFKTKQMILSNGPKLKDTDFSIGEDFSRRVQNIRKQLVAFAKSKTTKFSLRYKTLRIGPKRYFFMSLSKQ
ncbi:uncharacterized protein LOC144127737 [Amblyomma americanum]